MNNIFYMNNSTGELTEYEHVACRWLNGGDEVVMQLWLKDSKRWFEMRTIKAVK